MLSSEHFINVMSQISSMVFFSTPYIFTHEMINGKKEIGLFPLKLVLIKLIGSSLVFSYVSNINIGTIRPLLLFSFYGIIISLIFLIIYGYYYLKIETKMKIVYLISGIICYFFILLFLILINKIPFFNGILFFFGYTGIILSPFNEIKNIYSNKDPSLIPKYELHIVVLMAFLIGYIMRNDKSGTWNIFTVEINLLFAFCEIGIYYYLLYNIELKNKSQNSEESKNKIDENLLNNPINDANNNNNQLPILDDILKKNNN